MNSLEGLKIGWALTGSHCTLEQYMEQMRKAIQEDGATVMPILSASVDGTDSRFGTAESWKKKMNDMGCAAPITKITTAEPIGPKKLCDVLVVAPCSGNTMAKLANGITDSSVLMAVKAHLRNERPVVLSIATNDALGFNAKNLGLLLNSKNIFMVPFGQDDPDKKPNSLLSDPQKIKDTILFALKGKQIQPLVLQYKS